MSQAGKCVFPRFLVISLRKILEPFIGFFPPSGVNRKYVHTVARTVVIGGPAILCSTLIRASILLVLFPAVRTKTMDTQSL